MQNGIKTAISSQNAEISKLGIELFTNMLFEISALSPSVCEEIIEVGLVDAVIKYLTLPETLSQIDVELCQNS